MEHNQQHKTRKWIPWLITSAMVFLLAVSGRMALKSDWLFDIIRNTAVEQANGQINGTLAVEKIRGDLVSGFTISGITLNDTEGNRILAADSIQLSYHPLSLLRSPHKLDYLFIDGMQGFITQQKDSVWNIMTLLKTKPEKKEADLAVSTLYWFVEQIEIQNTALQLESEHLFPDGSLSLRDIRADLSAGKRENGFYGRLRALRFALNEQRLPEPIAFLAEGSGSSEQVTLETLVINSGRTLLESTATFQTDTKKFTSELSLFPLSRSDLAAYLQEIPLQQDITMEIGAEGSISDLNLSLQARARGLERLEARGRVDLSGNPVLKSVELSAGGLNLTELTGMEQMPAIRSILITGSGNISPADLEATRWAGRAEIENVVLNEYRLDRYIGDYSFANGQGDLKSRFILEDQQVNWAATVQQLFDEIPQWSTELSAQSLNTAVWLNNTAFDSRLNVRVDIQGRGFNTDHLAADAFLRLNGDRFGKQAFSEITLNGSVNAGQLRGVLAGRLDQSLLKADVTVSQWMEVPDYQFIISFTEINLEEFARFENLPTYINGTVTGTGRSLDPANMELQATARFDSTLINNEQIDTLRTDFSVRSQTVTVEQARLESPIADADFSLRHHLTDYTNINNRLDLFLRMKDPSSLAPLFGAERLELQGTAEGTIAPDAAGTLVFNGNLDLREVFVDSLFSSERIAGTVRGRLVDEPEVEAAVDITKPELYQQSVQDIHLNSRAIFREMETEGDVGFKIVSDDNSLEHFGLFRIDSTNVQLQTTRLNFTTPLRTLELLRPFDVVAENNSVRMDTMTIQSRNENAYLKVWAPHVDSTRQEIGLDARNINLGALQSVILEEPLFNAIMSGSASLLHSTDSLEITLSGLMSNITFEEAEMDTLDFSMEIADEWLSARLYGRHNGSDLFQGDIRIPYLPGDPLTFDEEFFHRTVSGRFDLFSSDLKYWLGFVPEMDVEQTGGTVSFQTVLAGMAGSPELEGSLGVTEGLFSGIPVDSVGIDLFYQHENEQIVLEGDILTQNRTVFDFDGRLPFIVDLKRAEILLPADEDSLFASLRTSDFDLALFNNYVDRDLIRGLRGNLNGQLTLSGPLSGLESRGDMELSGGAMRVVPAGINITNIRSRVNFKPDQIELQEFNMRSGPGRLQASGSIELNGLNPGELRLDISGTQFRAANTPETNAIVNLNASLNGTFDQPHITGSLTFLNGFVNFQNFGERSVEDVRLEDEEEGEPFEFYNLLAIEMDVNFNRQFYIRNRQYLDMEIELDGQVDLLKEQNGELQMFGSVEGARGYARPLGKNFELDEAVVSFYGPVDDPELNIRTRFEPPQVQDVRIYYIIGGTAQNPSFQFESEPEMELQDILSYTIFGKPFYELEGWEQAVAGNSGGPSAADLAIDVLLDQVEILASQRLGIDVVQIDNSGSGSSSTTSIKTGWYLNRRTFFAILNEISSTRPKTLFILEYMLRENLELIITQGDDSREGVDLRWNFDY